MTKVALVVAPLGLAALVFVGAAMSTRSAPESAPRKKVYKEVEPAADVETPTTPSKPTPIKLAPENAVILDRVRRMEERLEGLESKRKELSKSNDDLERKVAERNNDAGARMMAEWRVRAWEQLLQLTESQKQALIEMATRWQREPASPEAWLARESDLRSRLSVEQASALQASVSAQARQQWRFLGQAIGGMVGAPAEEQTRFQQTLGDYAVSNAMLLPEAHGADWPGLLREGAGRLRPSLSQDQLARLGRFIQN